MSQGFCTYFKLFVRNCKRRECFKAVWFQKIYIGHFRWNRITGSNNWQLRCAVELLKKRCYDTFSYPTLGWLPDSRIERIFKLWCCGKFRLKIHISWKRPAKGNCVHRSTSFALGSFGCRHWGLIRKFEPWKPVRTAGIQSFEICCVLKVWSKMFLSLPEKPRQNSDIDFGFLTLMWPNLQM